MRPSSGSFLRLALGLVLWARLGVAAPDAADAALATELFQRGRDLMAEGKIAEACPKFEESQRLDPGVGTLLNLALCHEALGKTATAWTEFQQALAGAERDGFSERIALAKSHIQKLEPELSRLTVSVPASAAVAGLIVERDGVAIGNPAWGVAMPIDPGSHEIRARAPGRVAWATQVEIGPKQDDQRISVPDLALAPSETPPPAPPIVKPSPREKPRRADSATEVSRSPWPYILGGAGVVALGVSGYAAYVAHDRDRQSDDLCSPRCTTRGLELNSEAKTAADVASVAFVIGIGAIGTAVYLIVTDQPKRRPDFGLLRF